MSHYHDLKQQGWLANLMLPELGLAKFTSGNVSAADRERGLFAIKPAGLSYRDLSPEHMLIFDFEGRLAEGTLPPPSDVQSHALLYRKFRHIGGICQTYSAYATAWAQALRSIPVLGSQHAAHCAFDIPCTRPMSNELMANHYASATSLQLTDCLAKKNLDYRSCEMALVGSQGPVTWGADAEKAVRNSAILEDIAQAAWLARSINPTLPRMKGALINKHHQHARPC